MSTVRTWADGFGRWYAEVPDTLDAPKVARRAIGDELLDRGAPVRPVVTVEPAPEYGPNVWREAD